MAPSNGPQDQQKRTRSAESILKAGSKRRRQKIAATTTKNRRKIGETSKISGDLWEPLGRLRGAPGTPRAPLNLPKAPENFRKIQNTSEKPIPPGDEENEEAEEEEHGDEENEEVEEGGRRNRFCILSGCTALRCVALHICLYTVVSCGPRIARHCVLLLPPPPAPPSFFPVLLSLLPFLLLLLLLHPFPPYSSSCCGCSSPSPLAPPPRHSYYPPPSFSAPHLPRRHPPFANEAARRCFSGERGKQNVAHCSESMRTRPRASGHLVTRCDGLGTLGLGPRGHLCPAVTGGARWGWGPACTF